MLGRAGSDCICRIKHWLARFAWLARGSVLIATVTYDAATQIAASVYIAATQIAASVYIAAADVAAIYWLASAGAGAGAANAATAAASQSKAYKYCSNKKLLVKDKDEKAAA